MNLRIDETGLILPWRPHLAHVDHRPGIAATDVFTLRHLQREMGAGQVDGMSLITAFLVVLAASHCQAQSGYAPQVMSFADFCYMSGYVFDSVRYDH